MTILTYIIAEKHMGTTVIEHTTIPHCIAYFCPSCGDIWARIISSTSDYWNLESVACTRHQPKGMNEWARIPGCISLPVFFEKKNLAVPFWGRAIEHFPPAVLKREFELLLSNYEKRIDNEQ